MAVKQLIHEGHTKKLLQAEKEHRAILEFKDADATYEGEKKARFKNKGQYKLSIVRYIFEYLEGYNIPTHWEGSVSENQALVKHLKMLPIRVMIHNFAAGSLSERFNLKPGTQLKYPIIEYYLKNEELGNPSIAESHAYAFGYATPEEMKHISRLSSKVNAVLKAYLERRKLKLVDYRLAFGRLQNKIFLADEISPDNARMWHIDDSGKMEPGHFRFTNNSASASYKEILSRLAGN